jgi:hypothetical protein
VVPAGEIGYECEDEKLETLTALKQLPGWERVIRAIQQQLRMFELTLGSRRSGCLRNALRRSSTRRTRRLEAFSDGVIAILITIMVLELRIPEGADWDSVQPIVPIFLTYVLSFVFLGIYWSNHHHLLHMADRITGGIMWANLHLLFWLSLTPFVTGWMGRNHFAPLPTAIWCGAGCSGRLVHDPRQNDHLPHRGQLTAQSGDRATRKVIHRW